MNNYKSISEILSTEKPFQHLKSSVDGYRAVDEFSKIFPELSKVAKAKKYDNGILFIHTENSVWRSELNLNKQTMLKKINAYFEKKIINNIKFI
ncbi:MAG: DUF721 domain-containing protein [Melioribacteraceae bacterium]|nr:DUF721 domain-containing protein [Melioribacteraceae bacterium]